MLEWFHSIHTVRLWNGTAGPSCTAEVSLADIVYVNGSKKTDDLQLTRCEKTIHTTGKPGLYGVSTDPRMTGYIKNYAWHYENEVRLRIHLPYSTGCEKIMVDIPSYVIDRMEVTTGPSFQYCSSDLYQYLFNAKRLHESGFSNLVKFRPLCTQCAYGRFVKA